MKWLIDLKKKWYKYLEKHFVPTVVYFNDDRYKLLTDEDVIDVIETTYKRLHTGNNIFIMFVIILHSFNRCKYFTSICVSEQSRMPHMLVHPVWLERYIVSLINVGMYDKAINLLDDVEEYLEEEYNECFIINRYRNVLTRSLLKYITKLGYPILSMYGSEHNKLDSMWGVTFEVDENIPLSRYKIDISFIEQQYIFNKDEYKLFCIVEEQLEKVKKEVKRNDNN